MKVGIVPVTVWKLSGATAIATFFLIDSHVSLMIPCQCQRKYNPFHSIDVIVAEVARIIGY